MSESVLFMFSSRSFIVSGKTPFSYKVTFIDSTDENQISLCGHYSTYYTVFECVEFVESSGEMRKSALECSVSSISGSVGSFRHIRITDIK